MRDLNTFKDVAAALREAECMRIRGEVQWTGDCWHDMQSDPIAVCSCGGIMLVAGLETDHVWTEELFAREYPVMGTQVVDPLDGSEDSLVTVLSHLNEEWAWPQIAYWLDTLPEGGEQA